MTPAERDEVRGLAERHLAYHPGSLRTCTDCLNARAVLRYVPPGEAASDGLAPVDVAACVYHDDDSGTDKHGIEIISRDFDFEYEALSVADARLLAHALHAAADAAEES